MKNIFYQFNKNGLSVTPAIVPMPENSITLPIRNDSQRIMYLSLLAFFFGAGVVILAKSVSWLINVFTQFFFLEGTGDPAAHHLGGWVILVPLAGGLLAILLTGRNIPLFKTLAMAIGIGTGAPLGVEGVVMHGGGALVATGSRFLRITAAEGHILLVAAIGSGMSWYLGAPVAAIFLALEVLLLEWSFLAILPVVMGAATGGLFHYYLLEGKPFFSMGAGPANNGMAIVAYTVAGLFIGLLSVLIVKLSRRWTRWFDKLSLRSRWWLLLGAALVGVAGYCAPETLGTGAHFGNDLLQAHVTIQLLFILGIIKLLPWLFYTAANKSGTAIMPLLIMGGATGLLLALIIQLIFPAVIINPAMAALIGMGALFAGVSRALLTAVILIVEMTHETAAVLPLVCTCMVSYGISFFLIKTKRKAVEDLALC
ncbi:chloride channel protein [Chitinophaga sp. MM2321]|uniref:chloride channel protein n=1 Tax=Chitinophaga sp. MM2321 TaxID=3137178 RepID=UPI0032D5A1FB